MTILLSFSFFIKPTSSTPSVDLSVLAFLTLTCLSPALA